MQNYYKPQRKLTILLPSAIAGEWLEPFKPNHQMKPEFSKLSGKISLAKNYFYVLDVTEVDVRNQVIDFCKSHMKARDTEELWWACNCTLRKIKEVCKTGRYSHV